MKQGLWNAFVAYRKAHRGNLPKFCLIHPDDLLKFEKEIPEEE